MHTNVPDATKIVALNDIHWYGRVYTIIWNASAFCDNSLILVKDNLVPRLSLSFSHFCMKEVATILEKLLF